MKIKADDICADIDIFLQCEGNSQHPCVGNWDGSELVSNRRRNHKMAGK
jgi:hypothetical protein